MFLFPCPYDIQQLSCGLRKNTMLYRNTLMAVLSSHFSELCQVFDFNHNVQCIMKNVHPIMVDVFSHSDYWWLFSSLFLKCFDIFLSFVIVETRLQSDFQFLTISWVWERIPNTVHATYFVHLCLVKNKTSNLKVGPSCFGWKNVGWYMNLPSF